MASRVKNIVGGAVVATAVGAAAVAFVGKWEGLRLYAYQDVVGVWTACYGETKGIRPGMRFTEDQCDIMFIDSLARHERALRRCLREPDQVPMKTYVAFLSFAYNVGEGGFCKSSVARRWNAGNGVGACNALMLWTKAGGRTLQGLVNRRRDERQLCIDGLDEPVVDMSEVAADERPILKRGDRGAWVRYAQELVNAHLPVDDQIKVDGQFGPATAEAVKKVEEANQLEADGVLDPGVWAVVVVTTAEG